MVLGFALFAPEQESQPQGYGLETHLGPSGHPACSIPAALSVHTITWRKSRSVYLSIPGTKCGRAGPDRRSREGKDVSQKAVGLNKSVDVFTIANMFGRKSALKNPPLFHRCRT
ncbi:unnamed protein product [Pleuronectes platessa]|uniref:Uncharacterized protein n=1 Tax=Pleuronectes platessa TaxID=8262 RepID=A0A9N7YM56_PLEPL|nr:unnamed protein product [Pleuronectes platessa]